jgi:alpha-beta hydrolase superfamily lysophospholipase
MMTATLPEWECDSELGRGFVHRTLRFEPDYDGDVTATLVRNDPVLQHARGAVLYLHGFIDYFFQRHVADCFNAAGYSFYALDLRKYGRSLDNARHPNFCKEFEEYFPEIAAAIDIIAGEGHATVVLAAHSTGALPAALYARTAAGQKSITRLILNSPFLAIPQGGLHASAGALLGSIVPFVPTDNRINKWYARSLHIDHKGEWQFNTKLKPLEGFSAYFGWVRAVVRAQDVIKRGLKLAQPVLVMHSDKSDKGSTWSDRFHRADLVLNVADIKRLGPHLGPRTVLQEIPDGKHDLTLSCKGAREHCLDVMLDFVQDSGR